MPPAPLPAPPSAAAFAVTFPPPAVGVHALHEDRAEVPIGCPLIAALAYIEWDLPAAPAQPSAPRYQLAGEILAAVPVEWTAAARHGFYTEDVVEYELDATYLSAAAFEIAKSGVFGNVFDSSKKFLADIATRNYDLSAAALKPAHFVATDPYAGPAALDVFHETSIRDLIEEGRRLEPSRPCFFLSRFILMCGPAARQATRASAQAAITVAAIAFTEQVVRAKRLAPGTAPAVVATYLPRTASEAYARIPSSLRTEVASHLLTPQLPGEAGPYGVRAWPRARGPDDFRCACGADGSAECGCKIVIENG